LSFQTHFHIVRTEGDPIAGNGHARSDDRSASRQPGQKTLKPSPDLAGNVWKEWKPEPIAAETK